MDQAALSEILFPEKINQESWNQKDLRLVKWLYYITRVVKGQRTGELTSAVVTH